MTRRARPRIGVNTISCTLRGQLVHYCPRLLICEHLGGSLEEYLPPSLNKRICLGMHLDNLRLKFLLCSQKAVP